MPTHFIRRLNMREQLIREVEIIPLEVVVRNVAAGSLREALRHRGGHAAAALDHRVLLQERRAGRSDGHRGAHHRLRLGDAPGPRRHHGADAAHQRLPVRPVPRRRHQADRLQARVRPPVRGRHDAHRAGRRDQPGHLAGCGTSRPTRRWTRTASAATSARSRRPTGSRAAARHPARQAARATSRGPRRCSRAGERR